MSFLNALDLLIKWKMQKIAVHAVQNHFNQQTMQNDISIDKK